MQYVHSSVVALVVAFVHLQWRNWRSFGFDGRYFSVICVGTFGITNRDVVYAKQGLRSWGSSVSSVLEIEQS
jgi:hypothetical protein